MDTTIVEANKSQNRERHSYPIPSTLSMFDQSMYNCNRIDSIEVSSVRAMHATVLVPAIDSMVVQFRVSKIKRERSTPSKE